MKETKTKSGSRKIEKQKPKRNQNETRKTKNKVSILPKPEAGTKLGTSGRNSWFNRENFGFTNNSC
jgi:hypothetical protein